MSVNWKMSKDTARKLLENLELAYNRELRLYNNLLNDPNHGGYTKEEAQFILKEVNEKVQEIKELYDECKIAVGTDMYKLEEDLFDENTQDQLSRELFD